MLAGNEIKKTIELDSNSTQFVFGCAATVKETSSNPPILLLDLQADLASVLRIPVFLLEVDGNEVYV